MATEGESLSTAEFAELVRDLPREALEELLEYSRAVTRGLDGKAQEIETEIRARWMVREALGSEEIDL